MAKRYSSMRPPPLAADGYYRPENAKVVNSAGRVGGYLHLAEICNAGHVLGGNDGNQERTDPQRLSIDPAVEAHMSQQPEDPVYGSLNKVRRARNMTASQRKKAARDKARNKVTYDLSPELQAAVNAIAERESIPASQAAAVLMIIGLEQVRRGQFDFADLVHRPSRSPRYDFVLELPDVPECRRRCRGKPE